MMESMYTDESGRVCMRMNDKEHIQPTADRLALNLEIILKSFSTNQNSANGIYD